MNSHPSISQLTLLVGGAVVISGILIFMIYLTHKMFKERREADDFSPKSPRPQDDSTFAMATMQGVITRMKEQEKELMELRQAAEKRARATAQISENVIREMPSGLMVFDRDGFISAANPAVRALLGVDTWSRRRYPEILGRDSKLASHLRDCLEEGRTLAQVTVEYSTSSGVTRVLGVSLSPFHSPAGEVQGAICLVTDLTEVQELQKQVRLKEHLAALGSMSAGIAHELKNSLATISGYAQLLRDAGLTAEYRSFAEKIVSETRALTQVVTDFLDISKPLVLSPGPVNIREIIDEVIEDLKRIDNFSNLPLLVEGKFTLVQGDIVLLRQALSNLLRNSCEAMAGAAPRGDIKVQGEPALQSSGEFLRLVVSDHGRGILESDREKVFLPFFTTKPQGNGLGLALVQKIIVSHNGSISLESSSEEGTSFSILLPVHRSE
jgi:PAS domain S-box-containing protein